MLMGTGAELWEFSNPDSDISQRYESALKEVLEYGARITFVGSIDDQLVPMEVRLCLSLKAYICANECSLLCTLQLATPTSTEPCSSMAVSTLPTCKSCSPKAPCTVLILPVSPISWVSLSSFAT